MLCSEGRERESQSMDGWLNKERVDGSAGGSEAFRDSSIFSHRDCADLTLANVQFLGNSSTVCPRRLVDPKSKHRTRGKN